MPYVFANFPEEDEALRRSCTKKVLVPGKRGQFTQEIDANKYLSLFAVSCTVYPNLNDVELQNGYGVMGTVSLLKKILHSGEYIAFLAEVQILNGFGSSVDELVGEANKLIDGSDEESEIAQRRESFYHVIHSG